MSSAPWQRRSGLVISTDGRADRARGFLDGALVVAVIESEPEYPDGVGVTVAVDHDGRVAVVDGTRSGIAAGPTLLELAEALAEACGGRVTFEDVVVGTEPGAEQDDPYEPSIDVDAAYVPDRSVVLARAGSAEELAALASAIGIPILAAPHGDGHIALVTDGPPLGAVDWPDDLKPALVVEQGAAYPAVAMVDGDTIHVHTWDADLAIVPAAPELAGLVAPFVDGTLGTGALVEQITQLCPSTDAAAVRAAIDGEGAGPARLVAALGLPEELVGFLGHGTQTPHLDGAKVLQPDHLGHVLVRAVTDASAQMSESMREHTDHVRERAEHVRERAEIVRDRAEAARVRAESAFDAAETFTEEVVVPIRQSWWTPAVAAVEATAGALALHRAGRGARAGTGTTAGERVLALGGVLLLIDAVVNAAVFLAPRFKKDL